MPRPAQARPHPAPTGAERRSPGDRGRRLGAGPRLPARRPEKQVTLRWGNKNPRGPAFGTRRCRPSGPRGFKLHRLRAKKRSQRLCGWT